MAHLSQYNSTITSAIDSSVFTTSCASSGVGVGDTPATVPTQISSELDKLLAQLKCKRTFQDEASQNGQAAGVYCSGGVPQLVGLICGPEKRDLKAETRLSLKEMENFFKEFIKDTSISNGNCVKEAINELFHNPEHIVFHDVFTKDPAEWTKLILPVLLEIQRKEGLKEELQKDIREIQKKRRELAKDIGLEKKRVEELQVNRKEKMEKIQADNIRRLKISLETEKAEADKLEAIRAKMGAVITNEQVEDLVSQFTELRSRYENLDKELKEISADGLLPPDLEGAQKVLENRKARLEALLWQQANPLEMSSTMDSSVF